MSIPSTLGESADYFGTDISTISCVVLHHVPGYGTFRILRVTNYVQDALYRYVENAPSKSHLARPPLRPAFRCQPRNECRDQSATRKPAVYKSPY